MKTAETAYQGAYPETYPESVPTALAPLIDPFGRRVSYLRLSVTDRCDFRCAYCMAEDVQFLPKRDVLSLEELEQIARAFVSMGVTKIRVTGGEPLVRRNVLQLFTGLGGLLGKGLEELTVTTNGSQLERLASPLFAAGVRRVNVSLDSLKPDRFQALTRRGDLSTVLAGLEAAKRAGLKVKINTVALKGFNEDELEDLVLWAGAQKFDLTFIEVMPMGELPAGTRLAQFLPLTEVHARLAARFQLTSLQKDTGGPSRYWRVAETGGDIGLIAPMTENFCDSCNRVRLTCTGTLYPCLGKTSARELRPVLRAGQEATSGDTSGFTGGDTGGDTSEDISEFTNKVTSKNTNTRDANTRDIKAKNTDTRDTDIAGGDIDRSLEAAIRAAIARKPKGHEFALHRADATTADETAVVRAMHTTGG